MCRMARREWLAEEHAPCHEWSEAELSWDNKQRPSPLSCQDSQVALERWRGFQAAADSDLMGTAALSLVAASVERNICL